MRDERKLPDEGISLERSLLNVFGRLPESYRVESNDELLRDVFGPFAYEPSEEQYVEGTYDPQAEQERQAGLVYEEFVFGADLDIDGINLAYYPQQGNALVQLYAITDCEVKEAIENLEQMEQRLESLASQGYDTSRARLKHENETTDSKRYELDVPVSCQEELDALVRTIKDL